MLDYVRKGDTVVVESISRFARNTRDLLDLTEELTKKGVKFVSQKEAIDTTTLETSSKAAILVVDLTKSRRRR